MRQLEKVSHEEPSAFSIIVVVLYITITFDTTLNMKVNVLTISDNIWFV